MQKEVHSPQQQRRRQRCLLHGATGSQHVEAAEKQLGQGQRVISQLRRSNEGPTWHGTAEQAENAAEVQERRCQQRFVNWGRGAWGFWVWRLGRGAFRCGLGLSSYGDLRIARGRAGSSSGPTTAEGGLRTVDYGWRGVGYGVLKSGHVSFPRGGSPPGKLFSFLQTKGDPCSAAGGWRLAAGTWAIPNTCGSLSARYQQRQGQVDCP